MKKLFIALLISIFLVATIAPFASARSYCCDRHTHTHFSNDRCYRSSGFQYNDDFWREDARYHKSVKNSKYNEAYDDGYDDAYDAAYNKYKNTHKSSESYNRGYNEGWDDGYKDGAKDAKDNKSYKKNYGKSCSFIHGRYIC